MSAEISKAVPRVDGRAKAEGRSSYIADYPHNEMLTARFYRAPFSRGIIRSIKLPELPYGYYAVDFRDVPAANHIALIKNDLPAFAEKEIRYKGQIIMIIAGPDPARVDEILSEISVDYEEQTPVIGIDEAFACVGGPIHGTDNLYADLQLQRGDPDAAFKNAARIVEGEYSTGFQEQLYMEPQGLMAWTEKQGKKVVIQGSMQCPYYVKHSVEVVLGEAYDVQVIQTTTGGAFGGKEDYPEIMGAPLAVAALKIGKPLRMIFDRTEDLAWTSKRHPSRTRIRTAHDESGKILAMDYDIVLDGGAYETYSLIVLQRAIFTSNGVYVFPNVRVRGRAVATSTVPSGAFRGFGAPQAIYALEMHMEKAAREFNADPVDYRLPYVASKGAPTITDGRVHEDVIMDQLVEKALELSDFREKRARYKSEAWKGIGISFFNHGCGFTGDGEQRLIKARARLRKNADDSVDILIANIDMGQGPQTTFPKIVARVLDLPLDKIHYENPDTDKVPNSGPTVASRTMMIVGYLVQKAAQRLKKEWSPGEVQEIEENYAMPPYVSWDQESLKGDAYPAFGWGVNVVEVEVDPVSWETQITGAWGVYDVGVAIDERVVAGQIQGGMSQVLGHASLENLDVDRNGVFRQRTMADYIVPTSLDFPRTVACTVDNPYEYGPFGAKGVGEIVHDGGHAAFCAAVEQATGRECPDVPLSPERLLEIMSNDD